MVQGGLQWCLEPHGRSPLAHSIARTGCAAPCSHRSATLFGHPPHARLLPAGGANNTRIEGHALYFKCLLCGSEYSVGIVEPVGAQSWCIAHRALPDHRLSRSSSVAENTATTTTTTTTHDTGTLRIPTNLPTYSTALYTSFCQTAEQANQ